MSEDYALRAIAVEELPQAAGLRNPKPDDERSSSTGNLAKLKRWLRID